MTDPTPAEALKAGEVQDIVTAMKEARAFMHSITTQRRKFGPIATRAQSLGWQLANAIERAEKLASPATDAGEDVAAYIRSLSPEHLATMMRVAAGRQDYPGADAGEVCTWREGVEAAAKVADTRAAAWRASIVGQTVAGALNASRIAIDFEDVAAAIRGLAR